MKVLLVGLVALLQNCGGKLVTVRNDVGHGPFEYLSKVRVVELPLQPIGFLYLFV